MLRLAFLLLALLAPGTARADDISAAGRGVVRVVVIAFEDGEVVGFGHGSGFAVAPNRVVTNAHVVALATQMPQDVTIGVVPSEGAQSYRARLVGFDGRRDLALIEIVEGRLPILPIFTGRVPDGATVAALGYPGNVDLATAQSAEDYIRPLPPTRSTGTFSNMRTIGGVATLLHSAAIARGNSGGPLLDPCGRVLGVNTLITRNEEGDASFFFAVASSELAAFLRQANQPFQAATGECISMADRMRLDAERLEDEERRRLAEADSRRRAQDRALMDARAAIQERRENQAGIAVLLLVLSLLAFGGAGLMVVKDRTKYLPYAAGAGLLLLIGAVYTFFSRPSFSDADVETAAPAAPATADADRFAGANVCRLVPERSRVTVSGTSDVALDWSESGCVNGRTQYAQSGEAWSRILVPNDEQTVSLAQFRPASGEYVVTRYLLDAETMEQVRALRRDVEVKACDADAEARTILAEQQRQIADILPRLPNERLVYACEPQRGPGD